MQVIADFTPASQYSGRRLVFGSQLFEIEGIGPVNVATMTNLDAEGHIYWVSSDWRDFALRPRLSPSATASPKSAAPPATPPLSAPQPADMHRPAADPKPNVECPKCGMVNPPGSLVCRTCGRAVGAGAEAAEAARALLGRTGTFAASQGARSNVWIVSAVMLLVAVALGLVLSTAVRPALVSSMAGPSDGSPLGTLVQRVGSGLADTIFPSPPQLLAVAAGSEYRVTMNGGYAGLSAGASVVARPPLSLLVLLPLFSLGLAGFVGARYSRIVGLGVMRSAAYTVPAYALLVTLAGATTTIGQGSIKGVDIVGSAGCSPVMSFVGAALLAAIALPLGAALGPSGLRGLRGYLSESWVALPAVTREPIRAALRIWRVLIFAAIPLAVATILLVWFAASSSTAPVNISGAFPLVIASPLAFFGRSLVVANRSLSSALVGLRVDSTLLEVLTGLPFVAVLLVTGFVQGRRLGQRVDLHETRECTILGTRTAAWVAGLAFALAFLTSWWVEAGASASLLGSSSAGQYFGYPIVSTSALAFALTFASVRLGVAGRIRVQERAADVSQTHLPVTPAVPEGAVVTEPVTAADEGAPSLVCRACGEVAAFATAMYCDKCGSPLGETS